MLTNLAVALMLLSAPESPKITGISKLYGSPSSIESSLRVTCAERTYAFSFEASLREHSVFFDRSPLAPTEEMSAKVLGVFDEFLGVPFIEASCAGPNETSPAGVLMLEIEGSLENSDRTARSDCINREGMYDPKSLWIIIIDGDAVQVLRDEIGQCTTKEYIDEINRLNRGKPE